VLSNCNADAVNVKIEISGFRIGHSQFLRIDEENRYTLTGETMEENVIMIPPFGTVEIKLFDL
jgi:hypothetical protein